MNAPKCRRAFSGGLCSSVPAHVVSLVFTLEVTEVYSSSSQIFNDQHFLFYILPQSFSLSLFFSTLSPQKTSVIFYTSDICPSFPVLFFLLH